MYTTTLLLYALVALLSFLLFTQINRLKYWQKLGIACEEPKFVLGNIVGIGNKVSWADIWLHHYKKFKGTGPFSGFYWFHSPAVFILDLALVKNILLKDFAKFTDRGFYSNPADDPLTGRLFLLEGHKWRIMRNKLTPIFTSGKMKFMFPTLLKVGEQLVQVFGDTVEKSATFEVKDLLARFTTDVIGSCGFGIECNSLHNTQAEFRLMGLKSFDQRHGIFLGAFMSSFPNLARRLHLMLTPVIVDRFFRRIVRETVEYREQNQVHRNDFMDLLIELKNNKLMKSEDGQTYTNLTLDEVAAQAFVFYNAGFETSSATMSFALYELAQHPKIQQRAREEVQNVFEQHKEFSYEAFKQMLYLDQIISETLRLHTVLPVLNRYCLEDYPVPGHPNYVIKKGMPVLIPSNAIHRDADYYPDPDVFNPDNFLPQLVKLRDPTQYLGFGAGHRNCIGQRFGLLQSRVGLALLLKHFEFSVCPTTPIPMKYNKARYLLSSKAGIFLKVEKI